MHRLLADLFATASSRTHSPARRPERGLSLEPLELRQLMAADVMASTLAAAGQFAGSGVLSHLAAAQASPAAIVSPASPLAAPARITIPLGPVNPAGQVTPAISLVPGVVAENAPAGTEVGRLSVPAGSDAPNPAAADRYGFDKLVIEAFQAGSTIDIDDLRVADLATGRIVYGNDFNAGTVQGLTLQYWRDKGFAPTFDATKTRIVDGKLRLETTGFGCNGAGGYDSKSRMMLDTTLPENFEMTFVIYKHQWEGHVRIHVVPRSVDTPWQIPEGLGGFTTNIQGGQINYVSVQGESGPQNILIGPGDGTSGPYLRTPVQYRVVKQNGSFQVFVQNVLRANTASLLPSPLVMPAATFQLVDGAGAAGNSRFAIFGNRLVTRESLDFEASAAHTIRVRATKSDGAAVEQVLKVMVTNVNERPTDIALSRTTIDGGNAIGAVVGTLRAFDPDAGDRHTFALVRGTTANDNASFSIVGGELRARVTFDAATRSSYTVRVRATDRGGLACERDLTVSVRPTQSRSVQLSRIAGEGYARLVQGGIYLRQGESYVFTVRLAGTVTLQATDHVPEFWGNGRIFDGIEKRSWTQGGWTYYEAKVSAPVTGFYELKLALWSRQSLTLTDVSLRSVSTGVELVKNGRFANGLTDWYTHGGSLALG